MIPSAKHKLPQSKDISLFTAGPTAWISALQIVGIQ